MILILKYKTFFKNLTKFLAVFFVEPKPEVGFWMTKTRPFPKPDADGWTWFNFSENDTDQSDTP